MIDRQLIKDWTGCQRCALGELPQSSLIYSGKLPADVLFVHSYPEIRDQKSGVMFGHRTGLLYRRLLEDANLHTLGCCHTYLVQCTPYSSVDMENVRKPTVQEIQRCGARFTRPRNGLLSLSKAGCIVLFGKLPRQYFHYHALQGTEIVVQLPSLNVLLKYGAPFSRRYKLSLQKLNTGIERYRNAVIQKTKEK